jgi:hypothetical protein
MRSVRFLVVLVLAVVLAVSSFSLGVSQVWIPQPTLPRAYPSPILTLTPICGRPLTRVNFWGFGWPAYSDPHESAAHPACELFTSPAGLFGPIPAGDYSCGYNYDGIGSLYGFFIVQPLASGTYKVYVRYNGLTNLAVYFTVNCQSKASTQNACVMQTGVIGPGGTIDWLGYTFQSPPPLQCPNQFTEYKVDDRTIVIVTYHYQYTTIATTVVTTTTTVVTKT